MFKDRLSILNDLVITDDDKPKAASRDEVFAKVCEIYKQTFEEDCDPEMRLDDLDKETCMQFISQVFAAFNVEANPQEETFGTIGDLVDFVVQSGGVVSEELFKCKWNSEPFQEAINRMDAVIAYLQATPSTESIGSSLLKVVTSVTDTFLMVANNFKTNFTKFYKGVKRAEIRAFYESNMLMCKRVEDRDYTTVMDVQMNIPTGMVSPYAAALQLIQDNYTALDIKSYADSMLNELKSVRQAICNERGSSLTSFAPARQTASRENIVKDVAKRQEKVYSDRRTDLTKPFKAVYSSMEDFRKTRTTLMDMEPNLQSTLGINDSIDEISMILGDVTTYMTDDTSIGGKFVSELAQCVRLSGTLFDVYGQTAMRQMALEHNHILNYSTIYKTM